MFENKKFRINNCRNKRGFTLIEISISLLIIGLIAGGIVVGADMIKAAEIRSILKDTENYKAAIYLFKNKYNALPGDMTNATKFWDEADGDPVTCIATESVGTETCNGDGNGIINKDVGEEYRAWQHLSNAGLIDGVYTGVSGVGGGGGANHYSLVGINVPESDRIGFGWTFLPWGVQTGGSSWKFEGDWGGHIWSFGMQNDSGFETMNGLNSEEILGVDLKIDDGKPAKGIVRHRNWNRCTDAADEYDMESDYDLSHTDLDCTIIFVDIL